MRLILGILFFVIYAALARYGYICVIKDHCNPEEPRLKTLDLILDDTIVFLQNYDQFVFPKDSILPNLNDNNIAYLDSLASVMNNDSSTLLTLNGLYRSSEKNMDSGMFENLGIARAIEIRKLLEEKGISEERIFLDSDQGPNEKLLLPIKFSLATDQEGTPDEFSKTAFTFTNMTYSDANFEKDSPIFNPTDALKLYADSVKLFFDANPEQLLTIIGHCDTDGTDEYNLELGKERAENAKIYFVDLGIIETNIETESKGESEPIAPNDTEENMQKNRRVQFVIEPKNNNR